MVNFYARKLGWEQSPSNRNAADGLRRDVKLLASAPQLVGSIPIRDQYLHVLQTIVSDQDVCSREIHLRKRCYNTRYSLYLILSSV